MPASRTVQNPGLRALLTVVPLLGTAAVRTQNPALAPTADTTIVVPSGALHYSSILVPAGVTVRFVAPGLGSSSAPGMPAVVLCDGDAIVHGTLWLAGDITNDRPAGWVTTGQGGEGIFCPFGSSSPEGGSHAFHYGSVLPFSLEGGSPGGERNTLVGTTCSQLVSTDPGGEGGGTLVLLAGGRIEIDGTVTADGQGGFAGGSGGSILLRGAGGVTVLPRGTVSANGGPAPTALPPAPPQFSVGAPGYVRLDAWGTPPNIQGIVAPAPTVLELPHMRRLSHPRIGTTWSLDVFAPEASAVFVAASPTPDLGTPTPFGPLGIDVPSATILAHAAAAPTGHDSVVRVPVLVPFTPALVGQQAWIQALVFPPTLPARLSNTIAVVVQ